MLEDILIKIKPSKKEEQEVNLKVEEFLKIINSKLKDAKAVVGGSFAKGTWLSNQHDIDIFVCFDDSKDMSNKLEKIIKTCFKKFERLHGSRDYFIVDFKGLGFELVPVLKIKNVGLAQNITDISPMHVNWVKKKTSSKLCDEIRLAKYFLKVNGCYGAETYVGGLSGYFVELLVINYKGFSNFIKSASEWRNGTLIHFGKNWFSNKQKFPLVVIDPVQPNRNASAALREDKFNLFIDLCKKFNAKPSESFFKEKKVNLKKYDLVFKVEPLKGSKDVAGTKMLKAFENIKDKFNKNDFFVKDSGWFWKDFGYFYFNVKNKNLEKSRKHYGPPIKFEDGVKKFRSKYKKFNVIAEKGRLTVMLPRKFINFKDFVKFIIKNKEIKDRVKSIKFV